MFNFISEKISNTIGDEAGRQNAIARFGTGMAIDENGMMADPRDSLKKISADDFNKLSTHDRMKAIIPAFNRLAQVKQIQPGDIGVTEGVELLKSAFSGSDNIARRMAGDDSAAPSTIALKAASLNNGPLMTLLRGPSPGIESATSSKMRPG